MGTRRAKISGTKIADWIGFDVITSSGQRVGIVEDVCDSALGPGAGAVTELSLGNQGDFSRVGQSQRK